MKGPTSVVEIGVECTEAQMKALMGFLRIRKIPFYVEPPRAYTYYSLLDLEADCEGK